MSIEIALPSLGDDDDAVQKATVSQWLAAPGDAITEGGDLLEVTTDKAAFIVPAPASGKLLAQCVAEGDEIAVGDRIAVLES